MKNRLLLPYLKVKTESLIQKIPSVWVYRSFPSASPNKIILNRRAALPGAGHSCLCLFALVGGSEEKRRDSGRSGVANDARPSKISREKRRLP